MRYGFTRCAVLMVIAAVACLLAGCGSQSAAGSSRVLRIWYSTDDPVERIWSQQLARRYEQTHPGVTVKLTDYEFEDINTKLQLALNAGDPPDLAYVTPRGPGIPAYLSRHTLTDMRAAARARGWAQRLRPGLLAAYNRPFGYEGAQRGAVMAVPSSLAAVALMVNQRLLQHLHLPTPGTFAALQTDLARAKAGGYTPIGIGNGDGWVGDDWYLTVVNALTDPAALAPEQTLASSFSFERAPFQRAAQILQRWAQKGYLTRDFGGLDAQEGIDQFFKGQTLVQLISSSENAQIMHDQRATHLPIDVVAFPGLAVPAVVPSSGYLGWVVPAKGRNRAEAINFIDSMLSPSTAGFLLRQGVLPSVRVAPTAAATSWVSRYLTALDHAQTGIYLDAAPVSNLNATMEANVQLLLQGYEAPSFLPRSLQQSYSSRGKLGSTNRIDGEF